MELLLLVFLTATIVLFFKLRASRRSHTDKSAKWEAEQQIFQQQHRQVVAEYEVQVAALKDELTNLSRFKDVVDASAEAERLRKEAAQMKTAAESEARKTLDDASKSVEQVLREASIRAAAISASVDADAKSKRAQIANALAEATAKADQIVRDANARAEEIAGSAFIAMREADSIKAAAAAMKNVIEGYGDRYLRPTYSLLDEIAEEYGFEDAGRQLKLARDRTKLMIEEKRAATCEYVEAIRRETAIQFVLDAFNGKVDSILTRTKSDNHGTLEQQMKDAFALVNRNGAAFKNARITENYLTSRLDELKFAAQVIALKERDKEEQRRIREQIREEEKARREIERALKDAAKEEESLQKAIEKAQAQVAKANAEQRASFEAKLAELQVQLAQAEARGQRALSMAQQTKAGHVYVISNIGSFGEHIYKVGMTRRLEPLDRVRELGDASVPFNFDVHAMIWCDDAPGLESKLHKSFLSAQVNKVNPRKEFFRLPIADIRGHIEAIGIQANWTMAAAAAEYRESVAIEQRLRENPIEAAEWVEHQLAAANVQEILLTSEEE